MASGSTSVPAAAELTPARLHALFDILTHAQTYAEIERFKHPETIDYYGHPFDVKPSSSRNDASSAPKSASTTAAPITTPPTTEPSAPILQSLLQKFALRLPGLRDVSPAFWQERLQTLMRELGAAELSESYDKGQLSLRRTLATAFSAIFEYAARGAFGGFDRRDFNLAVAMKGMAVEDERMDNQRKEDEKGNAGEGEEKDQKYDMGCPEDVLRGWNDFAHNLIYGGLMDEMFERAAQTDNLEEHGELVQVAHEYILVNIASLLHHLIILSPDGPYLMRTLENVHKLVPYGLVRQTLRVGNAATMINGMVRLVLTKLSLSTVTNWIGLTKGPDEGMNLLQQIISTVLWWDTMDLQRRVTKIEKQKDGLSKEQLQAIRSWIPKSRAEHEAARERSKSESKSIIAIIFETSSPPFAAKKLSNAHHGLAIDYLALHLSIRDRDELTKLLCKHQPDHLTAAIRDLVAAYDPIIRALHNAVDLSGTITDAEAFINDLIRLSKGVDRVNGGPSIKRSATNGTNTPVGYASGNESAGSGTETPRRFRNGNGRRTREAGNGNGGAEPPSVADFVALLRRHQASSHRFLHQVAKNGPEMAGWFRDYAHEALAEFRVGDPAGHGAGAGRMTPRLRELFGELPAEKRAQLGERLDRHAEYLATLESASTERLSIILNQRGSGSAPEPAHPEGHDLAGPGMYLARWQALLDTTLITPARPHGKVRTGKDPSVREMGRVGVDGVKRGIRGAGTTGNQHQLPNHVEVDELDVDGAAEGDGIRVGAPDMSVVVEALGEKFWDLLIEVRKESEAKKVGAKPEAKQEDVD
ncbi:PX-associated-domain-containing protein [Lineolata rhizophorae]|uniref:PX-associated-domain-containing protein n=1 Tax=Lineolata rhizophorae TaxID=578093 RepID=A0A6A6NW09_9PEZI|nr:PX-associated-domain-containing protein [Lineolata rhizophorae]